MRSRLPVAHSLLLVVMAVVLVSAGGCRWFKHKSSYAQSPENRPLEVPPDLDLPNTANATTLPPASGLGAKTGMGSPPSEVGFVVNGAVADVYPRVGTALEGIDGVVISGRAAALGSYDVGYQGQNFLVRVEEVSGSTRVYAISVNGQFLRAGPASQLLAILKTKLQ